MVEQIDELIFIFRRAKQELL